MSRSFLTSVSTKHFKQEGWLDQALSMAEVTQQQGMPLSRDIVYHIIHQCIKQQDVELARKVQSLMVHSGLDSVPVLTDQLVHIFASCGKLIDANKAFDKVVKPSQFTWNTIISGHVKSGGSEQVIQFLNKMQLEDTKLDEVTLSNALKACGKAASLEQGRHIHGQVILNGLDFDIVVGSTLVDMYFKCGTLEEAREVFDRLPNRDVVTWGAMIAGYAQHGEGYLALECFESMRYMGIQPSKVTFANILKACSSICAIQQGRHIHRLIIEGEFDTDIFVWNTLVDMYAKCGQFEEALRLFNKMACRDVVTYNAMIAGYTQNGEGSLALELFDRMQHEKLKPNRVTILGVLKACGSIGAVDRGRHIHRRSIECGLQSDIFIGSALVDMYAKCGNMEDAREVFYTMPEHNVVTWDTMIAGYAYCGDVNSASKCLMEMQQEGIAPNEVTYATILGTYSHVGLVDEGCKCFICMTEDHNIIPDSRHYNCMVDLLGRAGQLYQAENLLQIIPPEVINWVSLLVACRTYGNIELGRHCFDQIMQLDPRYSGGYMLMVGIYLDACMWKEAITIEDLRQCASAWKKPAKTWIEVNNKVHEFIVRDKNHPQRGEIASILRRLNKRMMEEGYTPKTNLPVLKQMANSKEDSFCGHSEKLAIAFGLLCTPPGVTIRATKNLRMCIDCHSATKIISKIENRRIVIRDGYRIHNFQEGSCSCDDYY